MKQLPFVSGGLAALLCLASASFPLSAQESGGTVRGRVTDAATQQPLQGVTVSVGSRSSTSQLDGRYTIAGIPAGSHNLQARMIGYAVQTQPITLAGGDTVVVDIALTGQAIGLSEVVVIGYGEQRAGNITGAVTQINAEQFNPGRVISPEQLIQSKVAGVQVIDNNEPGGGLSIRVRGTTSINASAEPLYIVDGLPVGGGAGGGLSAGRNPLNALNPNDIESITVLKDASAAAIYGANGANGVVIIETKKGRSGPQFEYTGTMSSSTVTRLPDMLDTAQFRAAVTTYAPAKLSQLQTANTNWFDLVTQNATGQEHNVAASGVGDNSNWRLSLGHLNQEGVIRGTNLKRTTLGLNLQQRMLDDRLELRTSLKGSRADDRFTPGGVLSNAAQYGPTQPVFDPASTTGYYEWPGNQLQSADNPVAILGLARDVGLTWRGLGTVQTTYRIPFLEGLRATVNLGYDFARAQRNVRNPSTMHSETKDGSFGQDFRSNLSETKSSFEAYANYTAPIGVLSGTVDVTGGYSYSFQHGEFPWIRGDSLRPDITGGNGAISAAQIATFQDIQESKLVSFFGRLNYNRNDRFLAGISLRRDGSSRFGPENQWGTFPSVAFAWRLSQEPFIQNTGIFSDLKLRTSWAKTGNQAFANYQQFATYLPGDPLTRTQWGNEFISTIRPSAYDPNIRWETTQAINIGLDFGLWNQRLTGTIDWYTKKTNDLIFTVPVCAGCNLSNFATQNIGSMRNRGFELGMNWQALDGGASGGLSWSAGFTAAHNTNEMLSIYASTGTTRVLVGGIAGGVGSTIQVLQPGAPAYSFFVYHHIRDAAGKPIWQDRTGLDASGHFTGNPDGTINDQDLYEDINGDNRINGDDRVPFHSPDPKWILGHSSYIAYGNFDVSFTLRAYLGNWVYNNVASNMGTYSEVTRASPFNLHASVLETGFQSQQLLSDYYVEDASFLRMDNISAAYRFNYQGTPLRVFGTLQNAFTLTGYSGVDPTAGLLGIDNNIYPRSRTFTAGLDIRF
jgi:TonB-dependent starch-binding outer membrane protein SusC